MRGRPITEDDLHSYVDQVLDPARQAEIGDYFENHPDVAQRVQAYIRQREGLRAALAPVAEEPVPPELNLARMIEARRRPRPAWWQTAAAACLLVCISGFGGWSLRGMLRSAPESIAALIEEAADSYDVYAPDHVRPVEVGADNRSELADWVSQRLGRPVAFPDLSASGYRFMGGRVIATSHGPAVLFMYDNDHGSRLVMLSRRMVVDQNAPMSQHSRGSVAGFAWADNGLGYSLVGPVSPDILHPIADEVRRQVARDT
jgi:anti-sigma factor RsiW